MLYIYIYNISHLTDHSIFIHIQHLRHSHPTPMPRISWGVAAGDQEVSLSDLRGARGIWIKIGWSRCLMDKFPANQFRGSHFFLKNSLNFRRARYISFDLGLSRFEKFLLFWSDNDSNIWHPVVGGVISMTKGRNDFWWCLGPDAWREKEVWDTDVSVLFVWFCFSTDNPSSSWFWHLD